MKATGKTITREQIEQVLRDAQESGDQRLAACAFRALDGDSIYQAGLLERCASAFNARHGCPAVTRVPFVPVTGPHGRNPIDDNQIRELKASTGYVGVRALQIHEDCDLALRPTDRDARRVYGDKYIENTKHARERCAAAWNALHEVKS